MNDAPRSTRRQFLRGSSSIEALQDLIDRQLPENLAGDASVSRPRSFVVQMGRRAMACEFEVLFSAGDEGVLAELAIEALDLVDQLEDQLTVYRDHSEVSRLNAKAASEPIVVEPQLFGLLQRAVQLHDTTYGAFDITAGPLVKAWGFYRRQGRIPSAAEIDHALHTVGSRWLELDPSETSVFFRREGVEINLGGIGKGYALDRCTTQIQAGGATDFLLHGGQSSVRASGSRVGNQASGWCVGVSHPLRPQQRLAEFHLQDQALGTSGSGVQFFHHQGKRHGHVLDPRTGIPADGVLSATAIAPDAATADALATAFYVMGVDATREYCESHPEVSALLVSPGNKTGEVEPLAIGLEGMCWRLIDR